MQLKHMKLKNLEACVSRVLLLSTWQYHELYYIVPIKKIFSKGQTAKINDVPNACGNSSSVSLYDLICIQSTYIPHAANTTTA